MRLLNKFIILLPSLFLIAILANGRNGFGSSSRGALSLSEIFLNVLPFLLFIFIDAIYRKEKSIILQIIQSSFYVYILAVLHLTIWFVPLADLHIVETSNFLNRINFGINLTPFEIYNYYDLLNKQIFGNFVMLLPLGIYIPLLYKRDISFLRIGIIGFMIATTIESIQFVFSFVLVSPAFFQRSVDVDDIILNFSGFILGFIIYKIGYRIAKI